MEPLKLIKINSQGTLVSNWQNFLRGQDFFEGEITGLFDEETKAATIVFQKANGLQPDGVVGNKTFGEAMKHGFEGILDDRTDITGNNFPSKPSFPPLVDTAQRQGLFGKFTFRSKPVTGNPENIVITNDWEKSNVVIVPIPQLIDIKGSDKVQFHKKAAAQLTKLWQDWDDAGLMNLVLTWGGSFVPRFVRGSRTTLSNHAFGTAFDINVEWNLRGTMPALVGQKGSVRQLVGIANANGFYWGGHFSLVDGMHFEVAKLL